MAGSSLFANLARGAKVIALLLFLLPWVTVSCSPDAANQAMGQTGANATPMPSELAGGIPIARASGLGLATGDVTLLTDNMPQSESSGARPTFEPEIGVIAGAALILLALLGSFLKGGTGAIIGIAGSVLAAGALIFSVFMHFPDAARAALAASNTHSAGGAGNPTPEQIAQIIQVKPEIGFWLVLVVLLLAVVLNVLAMRKTSAPAQTGSPPPAV